MSNLLRGNELDVPGPSIGVQSSLFLAQILLGVQGQLQQTLQKLIRGNANEILEHELLGEQATDVTDLEHLAACRIDEITMAVVDHDEIALRIEP